MRATHSRKVSKRRTKKLARADLLVLECQQEKLSGQALNFGSQTVRALRVMYPKKRIALVPTSAYCDLGVSLAEVLAKYGRFRSILVVGHSSAVGIQLTNDQFCPWGSAVFGLPNLNQRFSSSLLARPAVRTPSEVSLKRSRHFGKSMPLPFGCTPNNPLLWRL